MAGETAQISPLAERFARRIRAQGPISVAEYMAEVNAFYYGTRDPFGAAGDFITAPEISQIFGELIGVWCADYWQRLGTPDPVLLVELGPGRGTLMADALRATRNVPGFHNALRLHLVERSPVLRRVQQEKLAASAPIFHDDIATLPEAPMLVAANEFLDALPIHQIARRAGTWHERKIALAPDGEGLRFALEPQPIVAAGQLPSAADGTIAELCPAAATLGEAVGTRLRAEGGAALFIDYGYWGPASGDTLQAVRRHRPHEVLEEPGSADLTAHVDFTAFADAASARGTVAYGPLTQREFLLQLGLAARKAKLLERATPAQADAIESGCCRLIDPAEMGDLFKVLALTQKGAPAPAGFAVEPA